MAESEKPANRSTNWPAAWSTLKSSSVNMPSVNPTMAWTTSDVRNTPGVVGSAGFVMWLRRPGRATAATPALIVFGIIRVLKAADERPRRARTERQDERGHHHGVDRNRHVVTHPEVVTACSSVRDQLRNHVEQRVGERDRLAEHPVAGEQDDERNPASFGTKVSVCSWIWVADCNRPITRPIANDTPRIGAASLAASRIDCTEMLMTA